MRPHVSAAYYFAEFLFKKILGISKRFSYRKWFTFSAKVLMLSTIPHSLKFMVLLNRTLAKICRMLYSQRAINGKLSELWIIHRVLRNFLYLQVKRKAHVFHNSVELHAQITCRAASRNTKATGIYGPIYAPSGVCQRYLDRVFANLFLSSHRPDATENYVKPLCLHKIAINETLRESTNVSVVANG